MRQKEIKKLTNPTPISHIAKIIKGRDCRGMYMGFTSSVRTLCVKSYKELTSTSLDGALCGLTLMEFVVLHDLLMRSVSAEHVGKVIKYTVGVTSILSLKVIKSGKGSACLVRIRPDMILFDPEIPSLVPDILNIDSEGDYGHKSY